MVERTLISVGHGTLTAGEFDELIHRAGIACLIDVRRFPGSRKHPQFKAEALGTRLATFDVRYRWLEPLGGRRRLAPGSANLGLRNEQFRAYADHMSSAEFLAGVANLIGESEIGRTAMMCSESLWWRCHRRLLADHLTLIEKVPVSHLFHDHRLVPHAVTPGASVTEGRVEYVAADTGEDAGASGLRR